MFGATRGAVLNVVSAVSKSVFAVLSCVAVVALDNTPSAMVLALLNASTVT